MGTTRETARAVPARSLERQALAAAITNRIAALRHVRECEEACTRVDQHVRDAQRKLTEASAAAKSAREAHSEGIARSAKLNVPLPSGSSSRAANQAELEVSDDLEAAKRAATISALNVDNARQSLSQAESKIAAAADAVLKAEDGKALLDELEQAQHKVMALRLAHQFYRDSDLYTSEELKKRGEKLARWEFPPQQGGVFFQDFRIHPRYVDWKNAREALFKDADALLPTDDGFQHLPLGPDPDEKRAADAEASRAAIMQMVTSRYKNEAAE